MEIFWQAIKYSKAQTSPNKIWKLKIARKFRRPKNMETDMMVLIKGQIGLTMDLDTTWKEKATTC